MWFKLAKQQLNETQHKPGEVDSRYFILFEINSEKNDFGKLN